MANQRILLYLTLFFLIYLIWAQWQITYGPKPAQGDGQHPSGQIASDTNTDSATTPAAPVITDKAPSSDVGQDASEAVVESKKIHVSTDVIDAVIDTRGGDVRELVLRNYLEQAGGEEKVHLLTTHPANFQTVQSGLVSTDKSRSLPHNVLYNSEQDSYQLAEGKDSLEVVLEREGEDGLKVEKILRFTRGSYAYDVSWRIHAGNKPWKGSDYMQVVRKKPTQGKAKKFIRTYTGGIIYNDEIKYEKVSFDDMEDKDLARELKDGWLAMIDHYFLTAWIPQKGGKNFYYSRYLPAKGEYVLGVRSPAIVVEPGKTVEVHNRMVAGPKLQYTLEKIEPGLELTVDYGILTIIAQPLFWLLNLYHSLTSNWGWAIILLTVTVKGLFFKLSEMSYRSMARMRKVAPRIQQMKERFGDDRQAMSKAMMDLYKQEKINPLGGCLPILVQMPVFIALYWVLLGSVEMRHAPFILWLTNLTDKDPYYVLPILMGISMFIQQKLNPAPVDPIQQKVFQVMPFAFTFMFAFFPSGLVLYWVVNNILSITQQYIITRRIENDG